MSENSKQTIRLPIYIGAAIAFGVFIGAQMAGGDNNSELFKSLQKLKQVITYVENDYVDEVETDVLIEEVIGEMLEKLDPHTAYITAEELKLTESHFTGNFEGIGIEFNIFNDTIYVVAPLSGGPSEKLGLMSGDKIIKVDDEIVAGRGWTNRDVLSKLRGPKGSEVKVSIMRKGEPDLLKYNIIRDVIPEYSLDVSYMVDEEIGYIKVSRFSATTFIEFKEALLNLKEDGMKKLILDLTGNPGGYMDRAIDMVDEFLETDQMIVYTKGKRYSDKHYSSSGGEFEKGSLIVLIDEGSASASEIVAGSLQDHDRALIVGRRSYGKGLVQLPLRLNDGSELRLVISRYYTPSGRCIQKPYNGNVEDYHMEYVNRFNSEVFNEDSVQVNNTLVFKTDKGRTVYGGGGIIPDYFVPLDTTFSSPYMNKLFNSNIVAEFTLHYFEENGDSLKEMGMQAFIENFKVSDEILFEIIKRASSNGIDFDPEGFDKSKERLRILTKSFIARSVWNGKGFHPVFNQQNQIFQKAIELFKDEITIARQ